MCSRLGYDERDRALSRDRVVGTEIPADDVRPMRPPDAAVLVDLRAEQPGPSPKKSSQRITFNRRTLFFTISIGDHRKNESKMPMSSPRLGFVSWG